MFCKPFLLAVLCSLCRPSLTGCVKRWRRRPSGPPNWSRRWCWLGLAGPFMANIMLPLNHAAQWCWPCCSAGRVAGLAATWAGGAQCISERPTMPPAVLLCSPPAGQSYLALPCLASSAATPVPHTLQVGIVTGGLAARQEKLRKEAEEAWQKLGDAATELECFRCAGRRCCRCCARIVAAQAGGGCAPLDGGMRAGVGRHAAVVAGHAMACHGMPSHAVPALLCQQHARMSRLPFGRHTPWRLPVNPLTKTCSLRPFALQRAARERAAERARTHRGSAGADVETGDACESCTHAWRRVRVLLNSIPA